VLQGGACSAGTRAGNVNADGTGLLGRGCTGRFAVIDYTQGNLTERERIAWKAWERLARCKTIIPNKAQFDLIRAIGEAPETGKYIFYDSSANGQGKTANLMNILCNIILPHKLNIYNYVKDLETGEEFPGFFDFPLYRRWPEQWPKSFWYICEGDLLNKVIMPEFRKWFPAGTYTELKESKHYTSKIEFVDSDWEGYFLTREQNPLVFEGGNVGLWIADEPPQEWQYDSAHMRIRNGGLIIVSATPVLESAYLDDKIKAKYDAGHPKVYYQSTDIYNNSISKGGRWDLGKFGIQKKGNLTDEKIEDMIENCDPEEASARLWGRGIHLSGRVFKTFADDIHIVGETELAQYEQIWFVIDPHDAKPPFAQWWAVGPKGRKILIRNGNETKEVFMPAMRCVLEYPAYTPEGGYETIKDTRLTVADFCRTFLEIEKEYDFSRRLQRRIMDPRFGAKEYADTSLNRRMRVLDLYAHYGIRARLGRAQDINYGTQIIKQMLDHDDYEPLITIQENCVNTIRAFKKYSYVTGRMSDDRDRASEKRKLTEKWKHAIDCTRYLVAWPPRYDPGDYKPRLGWREELKLKARGRVRGSYNPMAN